jgi:hypothetical protein
MAITQPKVISIWLYLDELHFKFEFRSGRMIFGWVMSLELVFCLNFKLSGLFLDVLWYIDLILVITQPNIIRQERNSNLNCNSSRYSDIPNIKSIYQRTSRKSPDNLKFKQNTSSRDITRCPDFFLTSFDIFDLIFGMWLYLDELQFKFEFCSGRMIFGWVMALELVFFFSNMKLSRLFFQYQVKYIKGRQEKVRTT